MDDKPIENQPIPDQNAIKEEQMGDGQNDPTEKDV